MSGMFMGKDFTFWAEVGRVMDKRNIKTAKALEEQLKKTDAKAKRDPMYGRVEIRDSKNFDRVLGSVPRPGGNSPTLGGDRECYNIAVMPPLSMLYAPFDPCAEVAMSVSHVRFTFRAVNWQVVLVTDVGLDVLVQISDFRFPGETDEQAHVRGMYAR